MSGCILVVDDDAGVVFALRAILEDEGYTVLEAGEGAAGLETLAAHPEVDLVITDLQMPQMDGMRFLEELASLPGAPGAILITAHGSERVAVDAMKRGALDYFAKPFDADDIVRVVTRSLNASRLSQQNHSLRARLALGQSMVFASPAMDRIAALVERAASRDVTVLITGESGTGKERVASALVAASPRSARPYVRFNCAALPRELAEAELFGHSRGAFTGAVSARKGLFREAHGGTLLLDEVSELDPQTQGALLRVLQERRVRPLGETKEQPVDVRVITATNRPLDALVAEGRFREDLLYRLQVVVIELPPLRDRREDIRPLATHFASRFGERFGIAGVQLSETLLADLESRPWPGNVRELENTIERLVALSNEPLIEADPYRRPSTPEGEVLSLKERVDAFERGLILETLRRTGGNQSEAARRLQTSRVTLISKMKKYGL